MAGQNSSSMGGTACIITGGMLNDIHAKTAHGLIRQSDRFEILSVIDHSFAGQDAGVILDGKHRNIPVYSNIEELSRASDKVPKYAIIGMATKGGILPKELYTLIREVLSKGIHVINGLHEALNDIQELAIIARKNEVEIYDIRKAKGFSELHFWSGKIKEVNALKIAVLGSDCAIGKRTTTKLLVNALKRKSVNAHMIFTGQTGWLQGSKYGFIFDATPNDFISGELEHAIHECWSKEKAEVIVLEGQSSLQNPSGPCGSEFIISGELDAVILQHAPGRLFYDGLEYYGKSIPEISKQIELIELLGSKVLGITLNQEGLSHDQLINSQKKLAAKLNIPVVRPLQESLDSIIEIIISEIRQ